MQIFFLLFQDNYSLKLKCESIFQNFAKLNTYLKIRLVFLDYCLQYLLQFSKGEPSQNAK